MTTQVDDLIGAVAITDTIVAGVREGQWSGETPCQSWSTGDVARHLVESLTRYADAFGAAPDETAGGANAGQLEAYRRAAARLVAGVSAPGAADKTVTVPFGTVPAAVALGLGAVEVLVHGWDIATASGQDVEWDDGIAERAWHFSVAAVGSIPDGRSPFAPPQPVAPTAPPIDRLVALLGRTPG
ncbi:TIGR03086 family metal-binding protein [Rhodococcus tukisamuensis]|uniref:TIGR03086 family protein n=1 Tax=Rhodococcus tukisamuensis TaxID=168276 RepID=A0A1G7DDQ4_9NOCA|nr:TIGR03086 family metal-binding protein [Rhodococcus tukisamuensis]SDE49661.1 TIGR03086 family protein [Rhodococcus tukisamuensis]